MEYFQESHNTFFPYTLFEIGNKKTNEIELPRQKLTASVWRIIIIEPLASLIDIDIDIDDANPLQDILTPRTIISFIRIDSVFNIQNIPKLQANIKIDKLALSILNNTMCIQKCPPDILSRYTLKVEEHTDVTQEFCEINFGNINININLYGDMHARIYNELTFCINIFDSSYLTMIPLIDTVSIGSYIEMNKLNCQNILHLTADKLNIRYGPTAGNAISTAKNVWKPIETQKPIMSRYIICNSTSISLKFGQYSTDEAIWLQSNECFYYAFRTQHHEQKLKFSVESDNSIVEINDSIRLNDNDNMKTLKVTSNKLLLITTKKLSTTQKQIIIKGQIELMNMTQESFKIHYKDRKKAQVNDSDTSNNNSTVILLPATRNGSFFEGFDDSSDAFIRLQLANENANGWSGEIPLQKPTANVPWLVKGSLHLILILISTSEKKINYF